MISTAAEIRSRVDRSRTGSFFAVSEYSGSRRSAAETAFSRLAAEGRVVRAHRGLYWKTPRSRFGRARPSVEAVLERVAADKGLGPTGWAASNALGLTTQVPPRPEYVVVGPPPSVGDVELKTRWNFERLRLRPLEIALLEVLRAYPRYVDVGWEEVVTRVHKLAESGAMRLRLVAEVAESEHSRQVRDLAVSLTDGSIPSSR